MELEEVEHVDDCPVCGLPFLGATPEDARDHMTEEHGPISPLIRFPTREYKQQHDEEVRSCAE